jgi:hypothetical protein
MVLMGNGDGTFQAPVEYDVGTGGETPVDVVAADFNGDGRPDLAVLDAWGGKVILMMNQGDGTFALGPSLRITGGLQSTSLVVGDFNNDGIPDLAAAGDNGVGILLGNGDGTFQPPLNYGAIRGPWGLAAGDFNGDGFTDLAVAGDHGGIAVLLNAADWGKSRGRFPGPFAGGSQTARGALAAGIAVASAEGEHRSAAVNENTNSLDLWSFVVKEVKHHRHHGDGSDNDGDED